jgi:1-acyl-sn-glycerol-3-phosphate acyltransferase
MKLSAVAPHDSSARSPTDPLEEVAAELAPADGASFWFVVTSYLRLTAGSIGMTLGVFIWGALMIPLLPWRKLRIRLSNTYGSIFGRWIMFCSGATVTHSGHEESLKRGPAIWAMNHASLLDIPLAIWLSPPYTVGVAKRQVIYYPFFGILYLLTGHARVDRGSTKQAVASLKALGNWVRTNNLKIFIWPEGTRSRDGRLLPIRKGIVHLAIQTGLPIQPMVTSGTQRLWPKGPPRIRPTDVHVHLPEPVDTSSWTVENIEAHLAELESAFIDALPPDQRPLKPLR